MTVTDCISLKGMRFHTRIGILPQEKLVPQPLEVDLSVWLSPQEAGARGASTPLLDYCDLYRIVADTVAGDHYELLEGLCEQIANGALRIERVNRVRVVARKPHAPVGGPLDYVEVAVERTRDSGA